MRDAPDGVEIGASFRGASAMIMSSVSLSTPKLSSGDLHLMHSLRLHLLQVPTLPCLT